MAVADQVDYVHLDKLELLSMRRKDFGTKCSWDLLPFGQNVVGTYCYCDKIYLGHVAFGTKCIWDIWRLGQISGFWDIFGTKGIGTKCQWDNSPRGKGSVGQFT